MHKENIENYTLTYNIYECNKVNILLQQSAKLTIRSILGIFALEKDGHNKIYKLFTL